MSVLSNRVATFFHKTVFSTYYHLNPQSLVFTVQCLSLHNDINFASPIKNINLLKNIPVIRYSYTITNTKRSIFLIRNIVKNIIVHFTGFMLIALHYKLLDSATILSKLWAYTFFTIAIMLKILILHHLNISLTNQWFIFIFDQISTNSISF